MRAPPPSPDFSGLSAIEKGAPPHEGGARVPAFRAHIAYCQSKRTEIFKPRQKGGRALRSRPQQAQQPLPPAPADRGELVAHLAGEGMTGIHHHPIGPPSGGGAGQFGLHAGFLPEGTDVTGQPRMGPVGLGRRSTHHTHGELPAPLEQLGGQRRPLPRAGNQPQPRAVLVHFRSVHQDGAPPMVAGE